MSQNSFSKANVNQLSSNSLTLPFNLKNDTSLQETLPVNCLGNLWQIVEHSVRNVSGKSCDMNTTKTLRL